MLRIAKKWHLRLDRDHYNGASLNARLRKLTNEVGPGLRGLKARALVWLGRDVPRRNPTLTMRIRHVVWQPADAATSGAPIVRSTSVREGNRVDFCHSTLGASTATATHPALTT